MDKEETTREISSSAADDTHKDTSRRWAGQPAGLRGELRPCWKRWLKSLLEKEVESPVQGRSRKEQTQQSKSRVQVIPCGNPGDPGGRGRRITSEARHPPSSVSLRIKTEKTENVAQW